MRTSLRLVALYQGLTSARHESKKWGFSPGHDGRGQNAAAFLALNRAYNNQSRILAVYYNRAAPSDSVRSDP